MFNFFRKTGEPSESGLIRGSIEGGIKAVRETACDAVRAVQEKKKPIDEFVSTGIEHSQCEYGRCGGDEVSRSILI